MYYTPCLLWPWVQNQSFSSLVKFLASNIGILPNYTKPSLAAQVGGIKFFFNMYQYSLGQYLFTRKRIFRFENFFMSKIEKISKNLSKYGCEKKTCAPLCPPFLTKFPITIDVRAPNFQKISGAFFDLSQKYQF